MLTRDPDPLDTCAGHGTHVAGIIAATALNNTHASQPFVGVAPALCIRAYRVFGCIGTVSSDIIIAAMVQAFSDGVNIISMSLGETDGWSETAQDVVAARIAERGVFVSVAAGNDGEMGMFDASSPASGTGVTAVASVDNIANVAYTARTNLNQTLVSHSFPILLTMRIFEGWCSW